MKYKKDRLKKIQENVNDSDIFWGIIQSLKPRAQVLPNLTKEDWYNHFSEVFNSNEVEYNEEIEHNLDPIECNTLDDPITVEEIKAAFHPCVNVYIYRAINRSE